MPATLTHIQRSADRFVTSIDWLHGKHSFSFGPHYDPKNTHHGLLLVNNEDVVRPGTGFRTHPHQDMEIVTWVLDGELEHKDTLGNKGIIYPGLAQRMSAGTGIWHSEMNPSGDAPVHFVQMWVIPDTERINPAYEQLDINPQIAKGGLVPLASGRGHDAAISIRQKDAVLWVGRLKPGETVTIPDARFIHVFVPKGAAELEGVGRLEAGDSVRLVAAGARRFTADAAGGAEVLVWEMNSHLRGW
ncbi:MAG TPA: pirin family protein [Nitrospiria bacterium]|nr:pirin family protein [Nitrospiria bacterium]